LSTGFDRDRDEFARGARAIVVYPDHGASARDAEARLDGGGRVLVRPSGTEPALRVMVEGPDAALVSELADAIATLAGERLN